MDNFEERFQHLKGSPHQVGFAMGQILGDRLAHNIERYIHEFAETDAKFVIDWVKLREGAVPWMRTLPLMDQEGSRIYLRT